MEIWAEVLPEGSRREMGTILGWETELWSVMGLIRGPLALFSHRSCDTGREEKACVLGWESPPRHPPGPGSHHYHKVGQVSASSHSTSNGQPEGWVRQWGWATLCGDRAMTEQ